MDAFCGQGGAGMGYYRAGFDVIGVDIAQQPKYPFPFIQTDAIDFIRAYGHTFDAIHVSPPCQKYTSLAVLRPDLDHPDLVGETRDALKHAGAPYIIENVVGAPLQDPITLCGSMFGLSIICEDGLERTLRRHRLFESNTPLTAPADQCKGQKIVGVYGQGSNGVGGRGYQGSRNEAMAAMGIKWMTHQGLTQAVPPAYTRFLGRQLLASMKGHG